MFSTENVQYDRNGRMLYHPDFHFAHGKRMTEYELAYLCKFWSFDERIFISMSLGKTESVLSNKYNQLDRDGRLRHYRQVWDSYFEEESE